MMFEIHESHEFYRRLKTPCSMFGGLTVQTTIHRYLSRAFIHHNYHDNTSYTETVC